MAQKQAALIAQGQGPGLELIKVAGENFFVPSSALRAMKANGELGTVAQTDDGALRVANTQSVDYPERALMYARDAADRMRVVMDSGTTTIGAIRVGNYGAVPNWYADGAPNSMDAREAQRELTQQNFRSQRARWTFE